MFRSTHSTRTPQVSQPATPAPSASAPLKNGNAGASQAFQASLQKKITAIRASTADDRKDEEDAPVASTCDESRLNWTLWQSTDTQDDEGQQSTGGAGSPSMAEWPAGAADGQLDLDTLAIDLGTHAEDKGDFQLLMPNGQVLGVSVALQPASAMFSLTPPPGRLGVELQRRKMELQVLLARRMRKAVTIHLP